MSIFELVQPVETPERPHSPQSRSERILPTTAELAQIFPNYAAIGILPTPAEIDYYLDQRYPELTAKKVETKRKLFEEQQKRDAQLFQLQQLEKEKFLLEQRNAQVQSWPPSQPFTISIKPSEFQIPPTGITVRIPVTTTMVTASQTQIVPLEITPLPPQETSISNTITVSPTSLTTSSTTAEVPQTPPISPSGLVTTSQTTAEMVQGTLLAIPALITTITQQAIISSQNTATSLIRNPRFELVLPPGDGQSAPPQ